MSCPLEYVELLHDLPFRCLLGQECLVYGLECDESLG